MSEVNEIVQIHTDEQELTPTVVNVVEQPQEKIEQTEVTAVTNTIEQIYKSLRTGFENYELDQNNIVDFVIRAMTLVEQEKTLNGREKKAVVIEILTRLVDSYDKLNTESKISLKLVIRTVVPGLIDGLVQASKGFLSLNKNMKEKMSKCCCFSC
jgi:hypothetical protein